MSTSLRFRDFPVYKNARVFLKQIKKLSKSKFPVDERYILGSQIERATLSVVLNIAEGADRSTDKDFALFLNRSLTSLNEVIACLDVALDLKYIDTQVHIIYLTKATKIIDQLSAFRKHLLKSSQ